jgi:hypothetical protein
MREWKQQRCPSRLRRPRRESRNSLHAPFCSEVAGGVSANVQTRRVKRVGEAPADACLVTPG